MPQATPRSPIYLKHHLTAECLPTDLFVN